MCRRGTMALMMEFNTTCKPKQRKTNTLHKARPYFVVPNGKHKLQILPVFVPVLNTKIRFLVPDGEVANSVCS